MIGTSSNGAGPPLGARYATDRATARPLATTASELPATTTPAAHAPVDPRAAPPGDRVADVMARHQQVMQQFLETQRAVMLAYLGAAQGAAWRAGRSRPPA